ncbi:MAG: GMC family oxidoreductase [bacterium]|nr:GMC family oxidoreductase [bacterium]
MALSSFKLEPRHPTRLDGQFVANRRPDRDSIRQVLGYLTSHYLSDIPETPLNSLPSIQKIVMAGAFKESEAHALGTVAMADDPAIGVADRHLIHHEVRNLLVLGGSAFPSSSPANPTLTISALSLWAADHLLR